MRRFLTYGPSVIVLLTATLTLLAGPMAIRQMQAARTAAIVTLAQQRLDNDDLLERINQSVRDIAASVEPSVVFIRAVSGQGRRGDSGRSTGSGWVFDVDGHIVTNAHVVESATTIEVNFHDGRVRRATLIGRDEPTDVAVLKVEPDPTLLFPARRASGQAVYQGDGVFAFGSPFGFKFSMSKGIISGLGREARAGGSSARYSNFIQTDAAINPGNSGGPLVDVNGRVIGMNTAIITDNSRLDSQSGSVSGVSGGIGFAIPLETIETVVSQLIDRGVVVRGFMGVGLIDIESQPRTMIQELGLPTNAGVMISQVQDGGAAEKAGITLGDVITHVNGAPTPTVAVLRSIIAHRAPGERIRLTVWRDRQAIEVIVTLEAAVIDAAGNVEPIDSERMRALGSREEVVQAVRASIQSFGITQFEQGESGVRIGAVEVNSPAAQAGFKPGQSITFVQRTRVRTPGELEAALMRAWLVHEADGVDVMLTDEGAARALRLRLR